MELRKVRLRKSKFMSIYKNLASLTTSSDRDFSKAIAYNVEKIEARLMKEENEKLNEDYNKAISSIMMVEQSAMSKLDKAKAVHNVIELNKEVFEKRNKDLNRCLVIELLAIDSIPEEITDIGVIRAIYKINE